MEIAAVGLEQESEADADATRLIAASLSRRQLKMALKTARPGSYLAASLRGIKRCKRELGQRERSRRRRASRPMVS